jgi:S1-C subfamily serine protease
VHRPRGGGGTRLAVALVSALVLTAYLWVTTTQWQRTAGEWEDHATRYAAAAAALEQQLAGANTELAAARAQLATATGRISELANEKAQLGDENVASRQHLDYQARVSDAAAKVAVALGQCVNAQEQLIGYMEDADAYDAADLRRFRNQVGDLCDKATDGTISPDGFDAVQRMAVRVRNVGCGELSTGSGFAVDEHTLITNKHVVADSDNLQVSTYDGRDIDVGTAATAALADLAIVRTRDALPSYPVLAEADPRQGDGVTIVGYPSGGELTVTSGLVIGSTRDPLNANLGEVLVTDAKVEPGSSGSAALDSQGRVIGVVYAKTADDDSLLVPISTVREMLGDATAFENVATCAAS